MCFTAENRKILHEQETEKMLIHLLSHESAEVQSSAAQALAIMAENLTSRDSIREWGMLDICSLIAIFFFLSKRSQIMNNVRI
jgi:HEAT repeat protein